MRRHASSYFQVLPQKMLAHIALAQQAPAPWSCGLKLWGFPKTPCATTHVDVPMIVTLPRWGRVLIVGVGELAVRPTWWLSFRAGDEFTVHFPKKGGTSSQRAGLSSASSRASGVLNRTSGSHEVCLVLLEIMTVGKAPRSPQPARTPTTFSHKHHPIASHPPIDTDHLKEHAHAQQYRYP
jgi:hypothetical protein